MFFGLCNVPATFQSMMNHIFTDMIREGWLIIYIDNMLIISNDLETHRIRTKQVLKRLQEHDLYLKAEKSEFEVTEVEYLGVILKPGQVLMDPVKLKAILEWQTPKTVKQVQAFLGFRNFYRRFIRDYSQVQQEPYYANKDLTTSGTLVPSYLSHSRKRNAITKFTIENYLQ
ncbi:hypothetical protein GSI_06982 [Ganoderma sinense ZZ0214-1]|uniref:Reverse transcriptase domain-containing protein n=1 Tax=Ganoderma sinense ZZ0214-1 TaxID=1077348 RepID=A0A2G8SAM7_9APHY|nr:hypothetical protein GSI_06982 [Ganoderma sinense ZZ0214-1]